MHIREFYRGDVERITDTDVVGVPGDAAGPDTEHHEYAVHECYGPKRRNRSVPDNEHGQWYTRGFVPDDPANR